MTTLGKKTKPKVDRKKIENVLKSENVFIRNLYSILTLPMTSTDEDDQLETKKVTKKITPHSKTSRAKSLVDLQARIDKLKNKNNVNYKERVQKKNLKNRLKKKLKRDDRNKQNKTKAAANPSAVKLENGQASIDAVKERNAKGGKMVFSKIDFKGLGKPKKKKAEKDPKKLLEQVKVVNEKMEQLKSIGEVGKAVEIREKTAWKNALAKAGGAKVKDDPTLLKKTIKKLEQKKRSSKKKWEARKEGVQKAIDERQKKRTDNIEKRKKEKKVNKLKKAAKKGKIIPGF